MAERCDRAGHNAPPFCVRGIGRNTSDTKQGLFFQIFHARCHAATDVALGLVFVQYLVHRFGKNGVYF